MFHNGFKDRNIPNGIGNLKKTEVHTLHSYGVFRSRYGQACYKHYTPTGFGHIIRDFSAVRRKFARFHLHTTLPFLKLPLLLH